MLATDRCPNVTSEMFSETTEPTEYCTTHAGAPLQPPDVSRDEAPESRPDLRELDRSDRARSRERIRGL
jgi:hypothetical protein